MLDETWLKKLAFTAIENIKVKRLSSSYKADGETIFREACRLGCEGIVSKRLGSPYRSGRSPHWVKVKNPKAPAVTR
jgi:ATP-dependent DNA ligase